MRSGGWGRLSKQGQGALPPAPPLRAEPLEPASFRQGEGAASDFPSIWPRQPSPCLKLMDFKGSAFNGVQGQSPWPYLFTGAPTPNSHP
ncbi:hypothetical protein SAMN05421828_10761 [Acidiphilium rubrum]|uniref:Uncharacterized protein n=1 Tax=Acidiphilium rubrum TaxID=526 RepID=A0A8G2CL41_ACIRU|nr:hypothetical protein SAMN05421828_10761 [Acidiphilium rubrum]